MKVLIACEESQTVCKAFREKGHEAYSCDIQECSGGHPEWHIQGDAIEIAYNNEWDLMIAHPPCTYLTISAEWAYKDPDYIRYPIIGYHQKLKSKTLFGNKRRIARKDAILFVRQLINCSVKKKAIENPVGILSKHIGPASQYIQPYEFGEDASKKTGLWLFGLPNLRPTKYYPPRIVGGKKRWSNQTDSGQNKETPSENRGRIRSKFYTGWAKAMADQWG